MNGCGTGLPRHSGQPPDRRAILGNGKAAGFDGEGDHCRTVASWQQSSRFPTMSCSLAWIALDCAHKRPLKFCVGESPLVCPRNVGRIIMAIEALIIWLVIGAIAGWLAGMLVKGYGFGLVGNIVVGIAGAFIAVGYFRKSDLFSLVVSSR
jgi:hypothetical protein